MSSEMQSLAFPFSAAGERHAGLNMRQYAAIQLKVPNSGTEWLDDMIRTSLRNDFAAIAIQNRGNGALDVGDAMIAFMSADAMIAESETQNAEDTNPGN